MTAEVAQLSQKVWIVAKPSQLQSTFKRGRAWADAPYRNCASKIAQALRKVRYMVSKVQTSISFALLIADIIIGISFMLPSLYYTWLHCLITALNWNLHDGILLPQLVLVSTPCGLQYINSAWCPSPRSVVQRYHLLQAASNQNYLIHTYLFCCIII